VTRPAGRPGVPVGRWHDGAVPSPPTPSPQRLRRALTLALALLLALVALSGCARVRVALAVQPDDTVNGEIVVARPPTTPDDTGPAITVPEQIRDDVEVSSYHQEGYTGSLLRFSGLTFDQLGLLSQAAGPDGQRVQFTLRRAGNRLIVSGKADLTTVPVDKADFQLKITTSGEVLETNGDADGGTASWTFDPGKVGDVSAVIAADDPNAPSAVNWTLLTAGLVAVACAAVVLLARRTRNAPVR
jgi:hypothetical protein